MKARVRLPILVTQSKLLVISDDSIINSPTSGESVMDFAADVLLTITSREEGGGEVDVYADEVGGVPLGPEEIRTDARGRFEGWIERGRINVVAVVGNQSFADDFDLAPASDGSIDSAWIKAGAVTESKIDDGAVTSNKLANNSVTLGKIASSAKDQAAVTPSLRSLGTGANQAAAGNDERFTGARTPNGPAGGDLAGDYPNPQIAEQVIVNADIAPNALIAESKINLASDAAANIASRRTLGTGANQAAAGNDGRFPTSAEKAALAGNLEHGSAPSSTNPYVTKDDSRFGVMLSESNPLDGDAIAINSIPANRIKTRDGSNPGITSEQLAQSLLNLINTSGMPVGSILPYGGATAPSGFLLCDGNYYLITAYPELNNILNGAYGRNATHFGVPNMVSRFPFGGSRGSSGGASTVTLGINEIPSHSHAGSTTNTAGDHSHTVGSAGAHIHAVNLSSDGGHSHTVNAGILSMNVTYGSNYVRTGSGSAVSAISFTSGNSSSVSTAGSHSHPSSGTAPAVDHTHSLGSGGAHSHSFSVGSAGGSGSHENMPPWTGVNYIIKA